MTSTVPAVGELSEPSVLDALLRPRSVAMIGASRNPKALGGRPLGFMARYGFPGKVYPVNGRAAEVQGLPAYASIKDVPEPVDLALVMVRAELVAQVLRDCAACRRPRRRRRQLRLRRGHGRRRRASWSPSPPTSPPAACASSARTARASPACPPTPPSPSAPSSTSTPPAPSYGQATSPSCRKAAASASRSPSGAPRSGLDFSYIISTGNEFDLDSVELAGHLVELPDTDIVVMLIEGVPRPRGVRPRRRAVPGGGQAPGGGEARQDRRRAPAAPTRTPGTSSGDLADYTPAVPCLRCP